VRWTTYSKDGTSGMKGPKECEVIRMNAQGSDDMRTTGSRRKGPEIGRKWREGSEMVRTSWYNREIPRNIRSTMGNSPHRTVKQIAIMMGCTVLLHLCNLIACMCTVCRMNRRYGP
jgi:hypothetical protein